ncbi:MAG TPA: hypothetical protein ENK44_15750 [Caldithrix abyssi]|uniref:Uncharacterized protein n=1 Tax=Caldithrix abyssi TaxID=187145 RepID=A0A7V4U4C2_CALAY|nr:hypothetical protein [Caldithrix abyssi]
MITFQSTGNIELLSQRKMALFASKNTPSELYNDALSLFHALQDMPISLAGGWQAPLERHLFNRADPLKPANYLYYLAKDINGYRPSETERHLLEEKKLLVLSPEIKSKRPSQSFVKRRDDLLFSQIDSILFLYISPGGRLDTYLLQLSSRKNKLYILNHPLNQPYFGEDILAMDAENAGELFGE